MAESIDDQSVPRRRIILNPRVEQTIVEGDYLLGSFVVTSFDGEKFAVGNTPINPGRATKDTFVYEAVGEKGTEAMVKIYKGSILSNLQSPESQIFLAAMRNHFTFVPKLLGNGTSHFDPIERRELEGVKTSFLLVEKLKGKTVSFDRLPIKQMASYIRAEYNESIELSQKIGVCFLDYQDEIFWNPEKRIAYFFDFSLERVRLIPFSSGIARRFIRALATLQKETPESFMGIRREILTSWLFGSENTEYIPQPEAIRNTYYEAKKQNTELTAAEQAQKDVHTLSRSILSKLHDAGSLTAISLESLQDERLQYELCHLTRHKGESNAEKHKSISRRLKSKADIGRKFEMKLSDFTHFIGGGPMGVLTSAESRKFSVVFESLTEDERERLITAVSEYKSEYELRNMKSSHDGTMQEVKRVGSRVARVLRKHGLISQSKTDNLTEDDCFLLCEIASSYLDIAYAKYPSLFSSDDFRTSMGTALDAMNVIKKTAKTMGEEAYQLTDNRLITRSIQSLLHCIGDLAEIQGTEISLYGGAVARASEVMDEMLSYLRLTAFTHDAYGKTIAERLNAYLLEKEEIFLRSAEIFYSRRIVNFCSAIGLDYKKIDKFRTAVLKDNNREMSRIRNEMTKGESRADHILDSLVQLFKALRFVDPDYRDDYIERINNAMAKVFDAMDEYQ